MDAFSVAISLGTIINRKSAKKLVVFIGVFHFILPIIGALLGYKLSTFINLNADFLLSIILFILSAQIIIDLLKKEEFSFKIKTKELLLLALSVSIDSFTIGFGLSFGDNNVFATACIISLLSILFTVIGLVIGKYTKNILGVYAKIFGIILLLILSISLLF